MSDFIARLAELAGPAVAEQMRAEFGGQQICVPCAACASASGDSLRRRQQMFESAARITEAFAHLRTAQARTRREQIRAHCLVHVEACRPQSMTDGALLPLIRMHYADTTIWELRRALDYLAKRGCLVITERRDVWNLSLTREGINLFAHEGARA